MWWDGKILWDSGSRVKSKLESEIDFSMCTVGSKIIYDSQLLGAGKCTNG